MIFSKKYSTEEILCRESAYKFRERLPGHGVVAGQILFDAQGRARYFAAKAAPVSAAAPVVAKRVPLARSNRAGEQEPSNCLPLDFME